MRAREIILVCAFIVSAVAASRSPESLRTRHGFAWKSDRSATFEYFFEPSSPAERDIEKIKRITEQSRLRVLNLLGETSGPPGVVVFIVETRERMKQLSGYTVNGWSTDQVIAFVYGNQIKGFGPHEDCHVLAQHFWGRPRADWLNEGLAVYSDDAWWGHPLHALAKHLRDRGRLLPIAAFLKNDWRHKPDMVAYPELGSFVKFLHEKYGLDRVKELWQGGADRIPAIFGKSLADLEVEWHAILAAADARGIDYDFH